MDVHASCHSVFSVPPFSFSIPFPVKYSLSVSESEFFDFDIDSRSVVVKEGDTLEIGGHTYAAGLSMKAGNIPEFKRRFQQYVDEHIQPEQTQAMLDIEEVVDFKDITKKFHADLKKLAPHGPDNPKPLFCTRNVYDYGTSKVVGRNQEHIKLELVDSKSSNVMNGIAFGQSDAVRYIKSKRSFDIVYTIEENAYKRGEPQLQIEDIKPSDDQAATIRHTAP